MLRFMLNTELLILRLNACATEQDAARVQAATAPLRRGPKGNTVARTRFLCAGLIQFTPQLTSR